MKNKGLIVGIIIFLILVIIGLCGVLVVFISGGLSNLVINTTIEEKIVDEVYERDFKDINIDYNIADVEIKENESNTIKLVIYGEEDRTTVKDDEDKLTIETKVKDCKGFCFRRKHAKVELYLPKEYNGNIKTTGNVGDVIVDDLVNINLNTTIDVGDVKAKGIDVAKVKLNTGDTKISYVNDLDVEIKVGDVKIESINKKGNINIKTGDIKISKLNIETNCEMKTNVGDIKINKTNEIYVSAKTNIGDVKVDSDRKSDIELKVETNIGDIKVNY